MGQLTERQLDVLATQIRSMAAKLGGAWRTTIEIAIDLGEQLNRAKASVLANGGKWGEWVEENCDMSQRTAQKFMKLDRDKRAIEHHKTVEGALRDLNKSAGAALGTPQTDEIDGEWEEVEEEEQEATEDPWAAEEPEEEDGETDAPGTEAGMEAWEEQAAKHKSWVNDLNRIRREVEKTDKEHEYIRHCAVRIRNDLKALVATISQNTPVDASWKTKGEAERRRR